MEHNGQYPNLGPDQPYDEANIIYIHTYTVGESSGLMPQNAARFIHRALVRAQQAIETAIYFGIEKLL